MATVTKAIRPETGCQSFYRESKNRLRAEQSSKAFNTEVWCHLHGPRSHVKMCRHKAVSNKEDFFAQLSSSSISSHVRHSNRRHLLRQVSCHPLHKDRFNHAASTFRVHATTRYRHQEGASQLRAPPSTVDSELLDDPQRHHIKRRLVFSEVNRQ